MEIITYVREGAITHQDSLGNIGRTEAGDVQVMSVGSGVHHSEYNREDGITEIFQIWIEPKTRGEAPVLGCQALPQGLALGPVLTLASGFDNDNDALPIRTDALELDSRPRPRQHGGMTDQITRIRISLSGIEPEIWRRVDVPLEASLKMLHDIIQRAMGWMDYHLWEFKVGNKRYGLPNREWPDDSLAAAKNIKLKALVDRGVRQFLYTYDMGDNWEHDITVEAVEDGQAGVKYPRYVDGARRAPPEDVGGTPGFENFLEAIADPKHPEHQEAAKWYLSCYSGAYDPATFDERTAKLGIGDLAKRRAAGRAAFANRKSA